ncbi:MAG TPA: glycosyltransferase family 4 protein [Alphaproteobacteria bacterium]|jgi:glycosyltransferase involved in cell wall biosynthesis
MAPDGPKPKLLFLVTEDWYFCSHRLPIARAARDAGYDVWVATRVAQHGAAIRAEGFGLIPLTRLGRSMGNPLRELSGLAEVVGVYRQAKPDIVHHVAIKPALFGSLAARVAQYTGGSAPRMVNAIAGLGFIFTSQSLKARLLRPVVRLAFRWLLDRRNGRVIVQNPDDGRLLTEGGLVSPARLVLIKGSGVDLARFAATPEPRADAAHPPIATLVSRMIWDKGVGVLVEAARLLRARNVSLRVLLAGTPDRENAAAIPEEQLRAWNQEGVVEWIGFCDDVAKLWQNSHIAVLPSWYGEGVPKSLLEAAAAARPMVAVDGPGLREVVQEGETGLLVPPRDAAALADALQRLAEDGALRRQMGQTARRRAESEFGDGAVIDATLALYRDLLSRG